MVVAAPGIVTLRTGRLDSGERVGLGFTSRDRACAAFGAEHAAVQLHVRALVEMLAQTGVARLAIDPVLLPSGDR